MNDQKDLGGETYKGISRNYHYYWDDWKLIDNNKSNSDFQNLSMDLTCKTKLKQFIMSIFGPVKSGPKSQINSLQIQFSTFN